MALRLLLLGMLAVVGVSTSGCVVYEHRGYEHDYYGRHYDRDYDRHRDYRDDHRHP